MSKAKHKPIRTSCLECEHRSWIKSDREGKEVFKLKCKVDGKIYDMIFGEGGFETLPVMCADFKGVNVRAVQNHYFRKLNV